MKAREILYQLEKSAIGWGKKYQIAKVGDIVTVSQNYKTSKQFKITEVSVTLGRSKRKTIEKTLVLVYIGVKQNKNQTTISNSGIWLKQFESPSGEQYDFSNEEVDDVNNDAGLYFCLDSIAAPELTYKGKSEVYFK